MAGKVLNAVGCPGFVAIGTGNDRPGIVGHDQGGDTTHVVQCSHHAIDPVSSLLAGRGLCVGVMGGAQRRDEQVCPAAVPQCQRRSGKVHEQLLAGDMDLAHRALERPDVLPVAFAELTVLQRTLAHVFGLVLLPQQHQGHALAAEFPVHQGKVRQHAGAAFVLSGKQAGMQLCVAHRFDERPVLQSLRTGQGHVLGYDALGNAKGLGTTRQRFTSDEAVFENGFDHLCVE